MATRATCKQHLNRLFEGPGHRAVEPLGQPRQRQRLNPHKVGGGGGFGLEWHRGRLHSGISQPTRCYQRKTSAALAFTLEGKGLQ